MNPLEGKHENNEDQYLRELINSDAKELSEMEKRESSIVNLNEISSFFPTFDYWELLPNEIKCMIIKEVDFYTRFALFSCSKNMKQIAETVPVYIRFLELTEPYYYDGGSVFMITPRPGSLKKDVFVSSQNDEEDELVYRKWHIEPINKSEGRTIEKRKLFNVFKYETDAMAFVNYILKLARYRVDHLSVCFSTQVDDPSFEILDKLQVKKKLFIHVSDKNTIIRLLNSTKSPLDELTIMFRGDNHDEICEIEHETIVNAKNLSLSRVALNDSKLLNLKCEDIRLDHYSGVTDRGINTFLKRWVNGGGPDNFRKVHFSGNRSDRVLNNLVYVEWDDEFRKQNTALCNWIDGKYPVNKGCYYIESKKRNNGATLIIADHYLIFLITGKRQTSG